jgi:ribonuclease T2
MARLNKYWPSLNGPSQTFWAHEYEKHGTCAVDVLPTEFDFFNRTLAVRDQYDLTPALAAAGIVPSATTTFTKAALQNAATAAFGFPVLPECDSAGALTGVTVCINKNTFKAQSCGSITYGKCNAQTLKLLPLGANNLRGAE